ILRERALLQSLLDLNFALVSRQLVQLRIYQQVVGRSPIGTKSSGSWRSIEIAEETDSGRLLDCSDQFEVTLKVVVELAFKDIGDSICRLLRLTWLGAGITLLNRFVGQPKHDCRDPALQYSRLQPQAQRRRKW